MTLPGKLLLSIVGIGVITISLCAALPQTPDKLRFEVASIKPVTLADQLSVTMLAGGGVRIDAETIKSLIAFSYGISEEQISGGPAWMGSDVYRIMAKAEKAGSDDDHPTGLPGAPAWEAMRVRLRNLLVDRCQLVLRMESRQVAGYELVSANNGIKPKPSDDNGQYRNMYNNAGQIDARKGAMETLAMILTHMLGKPVEDHSGLTGTYDFKLEFAEDSSVLGKERTAGDAPSSRPSIFTALKEQIGLQLQSAQVPVLSLGVVHISRPSAD